jgi:hypothetical protein
MGPLAPDTLECRSQGRFFRGIGWHGKGGLVRRVAFDDGRMIDHRDLQLQIETCIDQSAADSATTAGDNDSPAWLGLKSHRPFSQVRRRKRDERPLSN